MTEHILSYYVVYKPYGMLSQFTKEGNNTTLAELFTFPKDVYPVGRLDSDSEGLLILTNDKKLNHYLLHPTYKHTRSYLAQVDGAITGEALAQLRKGVSITVEGKNYKTLPAEAESIAPPDYIIDRVPPIRVRKTIPTSWVKLDIVEGKNHQVRKMTAQVGFPTLRLLRIQIENLSLEGMKPSEVKEMKQQEIFKALKIVNS
jgi:23S rRNA pseudouridine2457 synthase